MMNLKKNRSELMKGKNNPTALYTYIFDRDLNLLFSSDTIKESAHWLVNQGYCKTLNTALDRISRNKNKNITYKGLIFVACKIFENDVEKLKSEWFDAVERVS